MYHVIKLTFLYNGYKEVTGLPNHCLALRVKKLQETVQITVVQEFQQLWYLALDILTLGGGGGHIIYGQIRRLWLKEDEEYLKASSVHVQVSDKCCMRKRERERAHIVQSPLSLYQLTVESLNHTRLLFYLL